MGITQAHRELAGKLLFQKKGHKLPIPDSLAELVAFAFTEEEALVTMAIGFRPRTARSVARRLKRPLGEVKPILDSLSEKVLIGSLPVLKVMHYTMLPLVPGVFESQILKNREKDTEYAREFARLFEEFYKEVGDLIKPMLDGKKLHLARIIPIEKSLSKPSSLNIMAYPTDRYMEMVDRNKSFAMVVCPCRTTSELLGKGCGKPKDVCSGMGVVADLAIQKGLARRGTREEFLEAKARAAEAGLVNMVDNLQDPLQVCSCCGCCCVGLRLANLYNIPALLADSHFESAVEKEKCNACGVCVKWCPMSALSVKDKALMVDYTKCIGCGVCVTKCRQGGIVLKDRQGYRPPPDNIVDHALERFMELKGYDKDGFLPRATLGIGRLLGKAVQPRISGPKYKPAD